MHPEVSLEAEHLVRQAHAPPHLFRPGATYFITAKTLHGQPLLMQGDRRQQLIASLQYAASQRGWRRVAWVVLGNHYHCILRAPKERPSDLTKSQRPTVDTSDER